MGDNSVVIALSGKGGVGKTSLSAAIVRILTEEKKDKKILAIDADPAVGLSVALGIDVKKDETLDAIRLKVAKDVSEGMNETEDILSEAKFRLLDALNERDQFSFLAIGRPEAAGCYCAINTYLRQVISMISKDFDYVVIDGEAGIEQINRRVMEKVTHLILVSDQSKKGIEIIKTIDSVSKELVMAKKTGAILNRILHPEALEESALSGIPLLSVIGADDSLTENDIMGRSVFSLDDDAKILGGARDALKKLEII